MKYALILLVAIALVSCSKKDNTQAECVTVQVRVKEVSKSGVVSYSPVGLVR